MKKLILLILSLIAAPAFTGRMHAQTSKRPKLVVGIIVDQMRYDYLYRFMDLYAEGGFKKLLTDGYSCENHHFSYMPTYTGPGHASVYTGTTPAMHGIIANDWWDKFEKKYVYCAEDLSVIPVGSDAEKEKRSPRNLKVSTLGDQIKLGTGFYGKVVGVSVKDRAAIFPAGHMADQAWWFTGEDGGKFITSSYYMDELPGWVKDYNKNNDIKSWLKEGWKPLLPADKYTQSNPDDSPYESKLMGKADPVFPYNLWKLSDKGKNADVIKFTPYGNTLVTDFAILAMQENDLGKDGYTDLLAISYSSPDYIGHTFGTRAMETEDNYLRLDREIARLIKALDKQVGNGNYLLFLTADHGAATVPQELMDHKMNVNYFDNSGFKKFIKATVKEKFDSDTLIENISNYQVFLNSEELEKTGFDREDVQEFIASKGLEYDGVYISATAASIVEGNFEGVRGILQKGYNQKYSGDVLFAINPGWISYRHTGTTHGSPFSYDTHVPLIFFGHEITPGNTTRRTLVEDIVPTVLSMLHMQMPTGSSGNPVTEITD